LESGIQFKLASHPSPYEVEAGDSWDVNSIYGISESPVPRYRRPLGKLVVVPEAPKSIVE
jgi:hypothetical protein